MKTIELGLLCFAVFFLLLATTALIFRKLGRERALALGLMVSQRNMGLMVAATDGLLPGLTWLYFALSQFPIYLSPHLLKPMVREIRARQKPRRPPKPSTVEPRSAWRIGADAGFERTP